MATKGAVGDNGFPQPHTLIGSAPSSAGAAADRSGSAGRTNSANPMMSPRLKHVKSNSYSSMQDNTAPVAVTSAPNSAPPTAPGKQIPISVDVHDLLNEMDNHQEALHQQAQNSNKRASNTNNNINNTTTGSTKPRSPRSRETSPNISQQQRRAHQQSPNNHLRIERDMLNDRCQQLQQQVRSLQLAYKESALRRVQEEQAFREILKSERDRFDRHLARLTSKVDDRDALLLEWTKAIYERNAQDAKVDGKVENVPELSQGSPNVKDMRNTFSLLSARSVAIVPAAKPYLTKDDIERANSASRDEALARRRRKLRSKGKKNGSAKKGKKKQSMEEGEEEEEEGGEEDEDNWQDPIGAFRPSPYKNKSSKTSANMRKKVGGASRSPNRTSEYSHNNPEDHNTSHNNNTDDNSTVTGSIMDVELTLQEQRNLLLSHPSTNNNDDEEGTGLSEEGEDHHDHHRPGSKNQSDARKEDSDRILQELVDALTLEDQLSEQELSTKNLKKHNQKKVGKKQVGGQASVEEMGEFIQYSKEEIGEFMELTAQEKETDRILTEFLEQNARAAAAGAKNANKNNSSQSNKSSTLTNNSNSEHHKVNTTSTTRTSMSAATNMSFSELNFTPVSTTSGSQKVKKPPMTSVTGKSMDEYMRAMNTASAAGHTGMFDGLTGLEDNRDLEQQLEDILQSVSDITKSIESSDDFVNSPVVLGAGGGGGGGSGKHKKVTLNVPAKPAVISEKFAEENAQAAQLNELLQSAAEFIDEADAAVGDGPDLAGHLDSNLDITDGKNTKKNGKPKKKTGKSVSIKLSPEEELRQIVQDTVRSTAEVTSGSAAQGQVASATREMQHVMRSSVDLSNNNISNLPSHSTHLGTTSYKQQQQQPAALKPVAATSVRPPAAANTATNNTAGDLSQQNSLVSSSLAQGSTSSAVSQPVGSSGKIRNAATPPVNHSATTNSNSNSNTSSAPVSSSAKAQKMVETYLGPSSNDALALMGRPSNGNTPAAGANRPTSSPSKPSSSSSAKLQGNSTSGSNNNNNNTVGLEGSIGSDNKYWWDISVGSSVDKAPTTEAAAAAVNSAPSSRNAQSRGSTTRASGSVHSADSTSSQQPLKLGGDLDKN